MFPGMSPCPLKPLHSLFVKGGGRSSAGLSGGSAHLHSSSVLRKWMWEDLGSKVILGQGTTEQFAQVSAILAVFFTGVPGACAGSSPGFHEEVLGCYQGCCPGGEGP